MKRSISLALVFLLLVSVLSACAADNKASTDNSTASSATTGSGTKAGTETTTAEASTKPESALPFAETLSITQAEVWRPENGTSVMTYDALQKRLNMKIEFIQIPAASWPDQYSMLLASGDLPDVVNFPGEIPPDWIKYKSIIPLNDMLDKYAPDLVSKLSEKDYIYLKSADGNVYTVPRHNGDVPGTVGLSSICIRQDWLDVLGLKMPVTLDEWEAVLTAFKNNDPNGNKTKDEIPWGGSFDSFWDAYGLSQLYVLNEDNTLTLKYKDKYYIEAVTKLADWYAKGLIDKEYITRNKNNTEMQAITYNGICGAMYMSGTHTTEVTKALRAAGINNALYVSAKFMEGPRGCNVRGRSSITQGLAITTQAKEPEKILQYLNYPFTGDGIELLNYGVEGETFDVVGGRNVLKQELVDGGWNKVRGLGINKVNGMYYWTADMFLQMTFKGKTVDTMDEVTALSYNAYMDKDLAQHRYQDFPAALNQVQAYIDNGGKSLNQELIDMTDQVIMGLKKMDDLKKLIDDIYADGFKQIEQEANELWKVLSK